MIEIIGRDTVWCEPVEEITFSVCVAQCKRHRRQDLVAERNAVLTDRFAVRALSDHQHRHEERELFGPDHRAERDTQGDGHAENDPALRQLESSRAMDRTTNPAQWALAA